MVNWDITEDLLKSNIDNNKNNSTINSMKRLLILLFLFIVPIKVYSEELPPKGCGYYITRETNPIYWGYMEDYGALLKAKLEKSHMFRLRGMGTAYNFIVTRDQKIKDIKLSPPSSYKYFDRRIKNIILSVEPPPFREGMNLDEMLFDVYLGYDKYDDIDITIGSLSTSDRKVFDILITTSK